MTVPDGNWMLLGAGQEVQITQQLGASITVRTGRGTLVRIATTDADALGLDVPDEPDHAGDDRRPFEMGRVLDALAASTTRRSRSALWSWASSTGATRSKGRCGPGASRST